MGKSKKSDNNSSTANSNNNSDRLSENVDRRDRNNRTDHKLMKKRNSFIPSWMLRTTGTVLFLSILSVLYMPRIREATISYLEYYLQNSDTNSHGSSNSNSYIDSSSNQAIDSDVLIFDANYTKRAPQIQGNWINKNYDTVKKVDWSKVKGVSNSYHSKMKKIIMSSTPKLIVNTNINSTWPIFNWNLISIAKKYPIVLEETRWQPEPVFVLANNRERGGMIGSSSETTLKYISNLSMEQFLLLTLEATNWLYWTGELRYFENVMQSFGTINSTFDSNPYNIPTNDTANDTDTNSYDVGNSSDVSKGVNKNVFTHNCTLVDSTGWKMFRIFEDNLMMTDENDNITFSDLGNSAADNRCLDDHKEVYLKEYSLEKSNIWHPMLWLSHPGTTAQTHYDEHHNVFVQVFGIKKFLLFHPKYELYSYPNIHKSYRQSQVHLEALRHNDTYEEGAENLFPLVGNDTKAISVVLHPGDVLYIPPYWGHRVESTTLSLSLSVISPAKLNSQFAEIYWENLPFGKFQKSQSSRSAAVQYYFFLLFNSLYNAKILSYRSVKDFAADLYYSRYYPLEHKKNRESLQYLKMKSKICYEPSSDSKSSEAVDFSNENSNSRSSSRDMDSSGINELQSIADLLLESKSNFESIVKTITELLTEIDSIENIKVTFLRDYVEQISRWAVGPDYTGMFINECLSK